MGSTLGNNEILAENLKYYMEKNCETRKDLCNILGFKYSTVTDWVKGKGYPRMDKLEKLARHFGITKSDLVEPRLTGEQADIDIELLSIFHTLSREGQRLVLENAKNTLDFEKKLSGGN